MTEKLLTGTLSLNTTNITENVLPKIKDKFWMDVFLSHMQVSTRNTQTEIQQFPTNPTFFNDNIKIGNKTIIYIKSCIENGIKYINDITKEDGNIYTYDELKTIWTASSEIGTYRLCEQRRFRRACASAQSRQNLRCSLIQAVSQEEPSDRKPDPWPLWMAGHAQLRFVMTEYSKTQIRLTGLIL